jgi:hypothetical protein
VYLLYISHLDVMGRFSILLTTSSMIAGALSQCNSGNGSSWDGNIGYDVTKVAELASSLSKSNWEWGTAAEALLELHDPDIAVFSTTAFPEDKIPKKETSATDYARSKISTDGNTLTAAGGKFHFNISLRSRQLTETAS